MKKLLLILTVLMLSSSAVQAKNKYALKHANPMPNLMRIAIKNAPLLDINEKQMVQLKAWVNTSKPIMQKMVKEVMSAEKLLHDNALGEDTNVLKDAEEMLMTRKKIIEMKTKCRATLKGVLTPEQYNNVITIYKSVR